MKIGLKIFFYTFITFAIFMVSSSIYSYYLLSKYNMEKAIHHAEMLSKSLALQSVGYFLTDDRLALFELCQAVIQSHPDISYIICEAGPKIIISTLPKKDIPYLLNQVAAFSSQAGLDVTPVKDDHQRLIYHLRTKVDQVPSAFIHLGLSEQKVKEELIAQKKLMAIVETLFLIIFSSGSAFFLSRNISRPVQHLCQGAERIGQGELAVRLDIHTNDEIEQLAKAFNRMAAKLAESYANLEQKVVERTLNLEKEIKERKRIEEQLQHYTAELKAGNEEIKRFAYIVSHDLRAPLVNLKGFSTELVYNIQELASILQHCLLGVDQPLKARMAEILQQDMPEALQFISSSVNRMDSQINSILKLSRLGYRQLKPELIDMAALVESLLQSMTHQIEEHQVKVMVGTLPMVMADRISMEQIMGNILDNALKYLQAGRPGHLKITGEAYPDQTNFHIRDNGRGIQPGDITKIFEIFCRLGNQNIPGEGMGLAYVKTLVARQGGKVWCESEPGVGTTLSFSLPSLENLKSFKLV